jgi:transposase
MPRRSFLAEISGNRPKSSYLSPTVRSAILAALDEGVKTQREIADETGCSLTTIKNTKRSFAATQSYETRPKTGRPPKLTPQDKRYIYLQAKRDGEISYQDLTKQIPGASIRTIRRAIAETRFRRKYRRRKRIELTEATAQKRLQFA